MQKAFPVAAVTAGVCLLWGLAATRPLAAQQPATPPSSQDAQQPAATTSQAQAPAPPPATPPPPVIKQAGDFYAGSGFSFTIMEWLGTGHPVMNTGHANTNGDPNYLNYGGQPRPAPGAEVTIPIGKYHAIHATYFRVQGQGNSISPGDEIIFGTPFLQGDYLASHYTMQNVKVGLDYLSWPFPIGDSKFHIKTLYEINYTTILTSVDAPLRHGETDASGNPITTNGQGTDWFIYPSFGLGVDYLVSHKLRFEGRASGFIFPHRSTIYDAEASLNYRFGKWEIEGGVKTFHFKTSPLQNEFVQSTFPGVYVGLRWYPEYSAH